MIVNDLQRLRWQILDQCLRDTEMEYFMGGQRGDRETEHIKSLLAEVNRRLREFKRTYKCSKRQLQLDVALFEKKGGRMEPRFRRGHKRILRLANLNWKNPLLRQAVSLYEKEGNAFSLSALSDMGGTDSVVLRLSGIAHEEIGTELWQFNTNIDAHLKRVLWAYGNDVEVLAPDCLRKEIASEMLILVQRYAQAVNQEELAQVQEPAVQEPCEVTTEQPATLSPTLFDFEPEATQETKSTNTQTNKRPRKSHEEKKKDDGQLNLFGDLF